jgi:hypothetical protein
MVASDYDTSTTSADAPQSFVMMVALQTLQSPQLSSTSFITIDFFLIAAHQQLGHRLQTFE